MELLISALVMLGLILAGFLLAEFQNAFLGKAESESEVYFTFIGVVFTQKDIQRFFFAVFLGVCIFVSLPQICKLINYELNPVMTYIIIGYTPSTVLLFVKKIIKKKTNKQ